MVDGPKRLPSLVRSYRSSQLNHWRKDTPDHNLVCRVVDDYSRRVRDPAKI
jgi:hypothetical protein